MMPLAIIGLSIITGLITWGVWTIFKSVSIKETTERYRYVKTKDEHGNEITKVIDLREDKE